ncbi:hypothetical protein DOY81_003708 [Sarcophaga bullata]|nr:hypothetical protein DOY81_003708 [Sarcophaga bullata]
MLPITRVNLDNICCTCLVDVRPTNLSIKNVYIVNEDTNLLKVLQATAYVTVLKYPQNLKFIYNYSRKLCQKCFWKAQDSYQFLEKIVKSTARLKDLLVNDLNKTGKDVKKLRNCCRICLNRQRGQRYEDNKKYLKWLQDFSGMEDEEQLYKNKHFPTQLCSICLENLHDVEIFLLLSTFSFEYIASEIDKDCESQDGSKDIGYNELSQKDLMVVNESSPLQNLNKGVQEEQKDGKKHFTDSPVYSTVVEGSFIDENHFAIKEKEDEDDIHYDFVENIKSTWKKSTFHKFAKAS